MLASDLALMDYDRKLRTLQNGLKFQIKKRIIGTCTFPKRGCCYFCCFVLGSLNLASLTASIIDNICCANESKIAVMYLNSSI